MRSKFENDGIELTSKLLTNYGIQHQIIEEQYSPFDMLSEDGIIEVKNRKPETYQFINEGLFLEKDKYMSLINYNSSFYINTFIFNDISYIYIWKLQELTPAWETKLMNLTNEFGKYNKVQKIITLLKPKDCIFIYKYENEKFTIIK